MQSHEESLLGNKLNLIELAKKYSLLVPINTTTTNLIDKESSNITQPFINNVIISSRPQTSSGQRKLKPVKNQIKTEET